MENRRIRLNPEELNIIESYRVNGTLPDSLNIKSDINKSNWQSKFNELSKRYNTSIRELSLLQKEYDTILNIKKSSEPIVRINPKYTSKNSEATMVIVASDWHIEETVDSASVNGLNEFNLEIAEKRINNFFKKSILMYNLLHENFNIKDCILALLGDFINGYIHEEFVEDNTLSPTEALLLVKKYIVSGIEFILDNSKLETITVPCCYGNHGRTTPKSRIATAYKNSYEWLMYKELESYFEDETRVKFVVANSYHCYVNLYDKYTLRFHHGDAMNYGGGIGGLTIPANKAIAQWNKSIPVSWDFFGHFHTSVDGGNFISNGSLVGYNAFANQIKASYEPPQQSMVLIDKYLGKILSAPLFVGEE